MEDDFEIYYDEYNFDDAQTNSPSNTQGAGSSANSGGFFNLLTALTNQAAPILTAVKGNKVNKKVQSSVRSPLSGGSSGSTLLLIGAAVVGLLLVVFLIKK